MALSVSLSSCAGSGKITKVEICRPIPFVDGEEAACHETVTNKTRLVNAVEWAKMKPFMLSISGASWTDIKIDWLRACRLGPKECNVAVESVDKIVKALDELAKKLFPINP